MNSASNGKDIGTRVDSTKAGVFGLITDVEDEMADLRYFAAVL